MTRSAFRIAVGAASMLLGAGVLDAQNIRVLGSYSGLRLNEKIAERFMREHPKVRVKVTGYANTYASGKLAAGECDVLMLTGPLRGPAQKQFRKAFGEVESAWAKAHPLGRYSVHIAVHKSNPLHRITYQGVPGTQYIIIDRLGGGG